MRQKTRLYLIDTVRWRGQFMVKFQLMLVMSEKGAGYFLFPKLTSLLPAPVSPAPDILQSFLSSPSFSIKGCLRTRSAILPSQTYPHLN